MTTTTDCPICLINPTSPTTPCHCSEDLSRLNPFALSRLFRELASRRCTTWQEADARQDELSAVCAEMDRRERALGDDELYGQPTASQRAGIVMVQRRDSAIVYPAWDALPRELVDALLDALLAADTCGLAVNAGLQTQAPGNLSAECSARYGKALAVRGLAQLVRDDDGRRCEPDRYRLTWAGLGVRSYLYADRLGNAHLTPQPALDPVSARYYAPRPPHGTRVQAPRNPHVTP